MKMKNMERAHLYRYFYLINEGNDLILHALHHLQDNPSLLMQGHRKLAWEVQHRRTLFNLHFIAEMQLREQTELKRLEQIRDSKRNPLASSSPASQS